MSSICLYLVFFLAVLGVDGSLFTGDKYVQEIGTHSQLQALLQHLASPNCGVDSSVGSGAEDFKISSDDMVYSIIFYADWCPHCHKQAPIWSNLAIQFHCTPGIRWFAFECSKGGKERIGPDGIAPFDACQNQSIAGFPTMYAYWPKRWDNPTNTDVVVDPTDFSIVEKVVNTVTGAFSPVEKVDQLFYNITTESGVQDEVILRSRMNNVLRSLFQYQEWILSRSPIHKLTRCTLTSDSDFFGPDIPRVEMDRIITTEQRWPSEVLTPCPDLRLHDGLSGFLYLLRNWVITDTNGLTAERNSDLRELTGRFLSLFPGFNTQLSLRDFHTALSRQSTFTSSEYQSMVDKLELAGLKAHPIGQRPDLLYTPRITSAIWLLFHTLTVSLFVQVHSTEASRVLSQFNNSCSNNQHVVLPVHPDMKTRLETLENLRQTYPQTPWSVAKAIRKTVGNFFGCDVCRLHFTSLFDVCYAGLCKWVKDKTNTVTIASETTVNTTVNTRNSFTIEDTNEGLLLWLWRFHNAVTFRTAVERTSDSIVTLQELSSHEEKLKPERSLISYQGQDVRFPPKELCPSCHIPFSNSSSMESFTVSESVVDYAVKIERIMRGLNSTQQIPKPFEDRVWDRIEDMDLNEIKEFLIRYLWRYEWMDSTIDLTWNSEQRLFISRNLPPRHLSGSYSIGTHLIGKNPLTRSIGTAGGIIWLFGLSTMMIFVAFAKLKFCSQCSLGSDFFRTMGLRQHLKSDHSSPRDEELGIDMYSCSNRVESKKRRDVLIR